MFNTYLFFFFKVHLNVDEKYLVDQNSINSVCPQKNVVLFELKTQVNNDPV